MVSIESFDCVHNAVYIGAVLPQLRPATTPW